jgi:hypothetical protein
LVNLNVVDAGFPAADWEVDFDNVRLDAVSASVPEPRQWVVSLLAILFAGRVVWIRRKKAVTVNK